MKNIITPRFTLLLTLLLSIILLILNAFALKFHLYFTTWWADNINHFLGGAVFALVFYNLGLYINYQKDLSRIKSNILIILAILIVGVLWEVFEWYFELTFVSDTDYWSDTILDVIMDTIGGILMLKYIITKIEK